MQYYTFFSKRENIILKMWGKLVNKKISQPAASFFSWAGCEIAKTNIIFINSFYVAYLCDVICDHHRMKTMSLHGLHQTMMTSCYGSG